MVNNRNKDDQNKQPGREGLSRRAFLRAGGMVIVASGAGGILVACGDEASSVTNPSPGANIVPVADAGSPAAGSTQAAGLTRAAAITAAATTKAAIDPGMGGGPTPTPTPVVASAATALEAAGRFLKLWEDSRFDDMYGMLSISAKATIAQEKFTSRYKAITDEATLTKVTTTLPTSLSVSGGAPTSLEVPFHADFKTVRAGDFSQDNKVRLHFEDGQWKVEWSPAAIFKELTDSTYLVHMYLSSSTRGSIFAANKFPLTATDIQYEVYVVPGQIENEQQLLLTLSQTLQMDQNKIKDLYKDGQPDWRMPIKKLPSSTPESVINGLRDLAGVGVDEQGIRSYPQHQSASHTVGYINKVSADDLKTLAAKGYTEDDIIGRTGVEAWAEGTLAGGFGGKLTVISPDGQTKSTLAEKKVTPSSHMLLSLNMDLQKRVEGILGDNVGSIVVMDVTNGAVLALANFPTYDPNLFVTGITQEQFNSLNNDPRKPFQNRAVNAQLPTGSTFKVITASAALERGGFNMQSTFTCTGRWTGLGEAFAKSCWLKTGHGKISLFEGIVQSCDVVFYELGKKLDEIDPNILPDMAKAYGLGVPSGMQGLYDSPGQVPSPKWKSETLNQPWVRGDAVNLAIGQGYFLASPMQLALVYAAIANGGQVHVPRLAEQAIDPQTNGISRAFPVQTRTVPVGANNLAQIRQALTNVTQVSQGTARASFIGSRVVVAGKTGTAESGQEAPHAWFACFAPANKPRYVVVAVVEHGGEGSAAAAPLARKVTDILPY
ncbi:MAG: penicillin-binding protein 2 [Chloroflexi bacterium]|nr:penicillin-binding protein 2 [Chloroflexota bacterium]OJV99059.1 MAG: penicillin-binding protein 2 [Chloroflexi bacterium 54-19]